MKFKVFIVFVFYVCCLLPGISLAQDKVVVIPQLIRLLFDNEIPTVSSAGQVWMDRNLGAPKVAESENDYRAHGWLYQWGRLADGHEIRSSLTTATLSNDNVPGHGNFITASSDPYDWRSPPNNNLWQGVSGVNNPCPAGFRLPTRTEWEIEIASWSSKNSTGAFGSPLKLVAAGARHYSDGTVYSADIFGDYWSSTVDDISALHLNFNNWNGGQAIIASHYHAYGFSVRCIKD